MQRRAVLFILAFTAVARADVTTERELRAQVSTLTAQVAKLTKDNTALRQKLDDAARVASSSSAVSSQLKSQDKTHAEEKGAVLQAQAETSETNATASNSLAHQVEFERQMSLLQVDLHKVVVSQQYAMYMLILMFLLVSAFTGVIVYSARRRQTDGRPE
jgi:hypothetical protein